MTELDEVNFAQEAGFDQAVFERALKDDVGSGDVTTVSTIPAQLIVNAVIEAKQAGVVAGLEAVFIALRLAGGFFHGFASSAGDGDRVEPGTILMEMAGNARAILTGERVALNFLQHLSGIATLTRKFVDAVEGTKARITDTRKTTPGLRALEKYAVRVGGG